MKFSTYSYIVKLLIIVYIKQISLIIIVYIIINHSGRAAQVAEGDLWRSVASNSQQFNDRAEEHWAAFANFPRGLLERGRSLGHVIEVGAGPWTQLKGILYVRPDLAVDSFTVWEPGAKRFELSSAT